MGYIIVRALHGIGTPHVSCVIHRRRRRRRAIQEPCQRFYCSTARLLHTRTHTQHPSRSIQRRRPADLSRLGIYDTYARARFLIDPPRPANSIIIFRPDNNTRFFSPLFSPPFRRRRFLSPCQRGFARPSFHSSPHVVQRTHNCVPGARESCLHRARARYYYNIYIYIYCPAERR